MGAWSSEELPHNCATNLHLIVQKYRHMDCFHHLEINYIRLLDQARLEKLEPLRFHHDLQMCLYEAQHIVLFEIYDLHRSPY